MKRVWVYACAAIALVGCDKQQISSSGKLAAGDHPSASGKSAAHNGAFSESGAPSKPAGTIYFQGDGKIPTLGASATFFVFPDGRAVDFSDNERFSNADLSAPHKLISVSFDCEEASDSAFKYNVNVSQLDHPATKVNAESLSSGTHAVPLQSSNNEVVPNFSGARYMGDNSRTHANFVASFRRDATNAENEEAAQRFRTIDEFWGAVIASRSLQVSGESVTVADNTFTAADKDGKLVDGTLASVVAACRQKLDEWRGGYAQAGTASGPVAASSQPEQAAPTTTPAAGSPERKAIMEAMRPQAEQMVGQRPLIFRVISLNVVRGGGGVNAYAVVQPLDQQARPVGGQLKAHLYADEGGWKVLSLEAVKA